MGKKKKSDAVVIGSRLERAEYCTKILETFDNSVRKWADLAQVLQEVERDCLYAEMGDENWDEWAKKHAPVSYRLCYSLKARFKALSPHFTVDELNAMPRETASWASKAKNISPAALSKPEVKEALMLPKRKAVEVLREALPQEHLEDDYRLACKFTASQGEVIQKGYEVFKRHKDETASFEDFVEFLVAEFVLSFAASSNVVEPAAVTQ